jgi:hypothetical protein
MVHAVTVTNPPLQPTGRAADVYVSGGMMSRSLWLVPDPEPNPSEHPNAQSTPGTCDVCAKPIRITVQMIRPHARNPRLVVIEVFARCTKPLRPHRYVSWGEYDPSHGPPPPEFTLTN